MNRIERKFRELERAGRKGLILYLTAGYPSLEATRALVPGLEKAGADIIELGVPFSDPIADGVTIQRTNAAALAAGVNLVRILKLVAEIRRESQVPIILMGYYNPILAYGLEKFVRDSWKAGVDGLIVPDLPPEEAAPLRRELKKARLGLIFLLAPTSDDERIALVAGRSEPFIYYVSVAGVTGARASLAVEEIGAQVARIRRQSRRPVCLGFGINGPEALRKLAPLADGFIVGSALLNCIEKAGTRYQAAAEEFVAGMAGVLKETAGPGPGAKKN